MGFELVDETHFILHLEVKERFSLCSGHLNLEIKYSI